MTRKNTKVNAKKVNTPHTRARGKSETDGEPTPPLRGTYRGEY